MTQQKRVMKRLWSVLLVLAMVVTMIPAMQTKVQAASEEGYTLTYDYGDGRPVKVLTGLTEIPELEKPTKDGFTFYGWTTTWNTSDCKLEQVPIEEDGMILTRDTTLYAMWYKEYDNMMYFLLYGGNGLCLWNIRPEYAQKDIVVPDEIDRLPVTELGRNSFYPVAYNVETIKVGSNVTKIGTIFEDCLSYDLNDRKRYPILKSITIPDSVAEIDFDAFAFCDQLTEVIIPAGVREIKDFAFYGCSALKEVRMEGVLTELKRGAFGACTSLEKIYYGGTEAQWNNELSRENDNERFYHSIKFDTEWKINSPDFEVVFENKHLVVDFDRNLSGYPAAVAKYIVAENGATITEPEAPTADGYTFAGWYTDKECTQAHKWNFAVDTVTWDMILYAKWIDNSIPSEPENPNGYTITLDYSDGRDVKVLTGQTIIPKLETPTKEGYTFYEWSTNKDSAYNEYVQEGKALTDDITLYAVWQKKYDDITYTLLYGGKSFRLWSISGEYSKTDIVVPDQVDGIPVTELGLDSFHSVKDKVETIKVGANVTTIEDIFERGSSTLKSITIPDSVTEIYGNAFSECTALTEITIPAGVKRILFKVFSGCTSLKEVRIEGVMTEIWFDAFKNCTSLEKIYYGGTEAQWNNKLSRANDSSDRFHSIKFESGWKDGAADFEVVFENKQFVVSFDENGNKITYSMPQYITAGKDTVIDPPEDPRSYQGCTFAGWYKDKECTEANAWNFATDTVTGDMTLYAKWVEDNSIPSEPEDPKQDETKLEEPKQDETKPENPKQDEANQEQTTQTETEPQETVTRELAADAEGNIIEKTTDKDTATGTIKTKVVMWEASTGDQYVIKSTETKDGTVTYSSVFLFTKNATITKAQAKRAEELAKKKKAPLLVFVHSAKGELLYKVKLNTKNVKKNTTLSVYRYNEKTLTYSKLKKKYQIIKSDADANIECDFNKTSATKRYVLVSKDQAKRIDRKIAKTK
ncbi:MAG: InlB B-repeat-containing protein [Agathobacter sp.]|nr:InlB B-repeat-containing protein [Agathobacter sp.]